MNDLSILASFLGWCTLINVVLLVLSTLAVIIAKPAVKKVHKKLFGMAAADLDAFYFTYLGHYKIAIIVFNLVPYCALKIIA